MQVFRTISDLQDFLKNKDMIGFVPTMGFLHYGHLTLVQRSIDENPVTVVSIFVNPSQFNDPVDFEKYPRDEERDLKMLDEVLRENDCVFVPKELRIQSSELRAQYEIPKNLKNCMCGRTRSGHFEGVVEVVGRLLGVICRVEACLNPTNVKMYLGQKDYQQVKILQDFVSKCFKNIEIVVCETVREKDGLAMSSRNVRLSENERKIAINLYKEISNAEKSQDDMIKNLQKYSEIKIDYIEIRDGDDLTDVSEKTKNILIAGAIFIGEVRLIDNVVIKI